MKESILLKPEQELKPEPKPEENKKPPKLELVKPSLEKLEREYEDVNGLLESKYKTDVEANPEMENFKEGLDTHLDNHFAYTNELIEKFNLSPEEKVAARIASKLHDAAKLELNALLDHHEKANDFINKIKPELLGEKIEGVEITEEILKKSQEAIERHMNHPFLVALNNKENFPRPQDTVDKIVFDADMLANIGFKNIGFRLGDKKFFTEDEKNAQEKNTSILTATFENVVSGARGLIDDKTLETEPAIARAKEIITEVKKISHYLNSEDENGANILDKLGEELKDNINIISAEFGKKQPDPEMINSNVKLIKKRLNEEIFKAGNQLGIEEKIHQRFKI